MSITVLKPVVYLVLAAFGAQAGLSIAADSVNSGPNLQSPAVLAMQSNLKDQYRTAAQAAMPGQAQVFNQAKTALPQAADFLQNGKRVAISQDGDTINSLIRSVPTAKNTDKSAILDKLQQYANAGRPEALNFVGFALEHGAFGYPKNQEKAFAYYKSAAASGFQTALYNEALAMTYGKGVAANPSGALPLAIKASSLGSENSNRVCGLASLLALRGNDINDLPKLTNQCDSALANQAKIQVSPDLTTDKKVFLLRAAYGAGVDSALLEIVDVAKVDKSRERDLLVCKYQLVVRYRNSSDFQNVSADAQKCFPKGDLESIRLAGLAGGFVKQELQNLTQLRNGNKFHFAWGVPYLPFKQNDVDLFASTINGSKPQ